RDRRCVLRIELQDAHASTGLDVPKPSGLVTTGGERKPSIRRDGHVIDGACVTSEHTSANPAGYVPHDQCAAGGHGAAAVVAQSEGKDGTTDHQGSRQSVMPAPALPTTLRSP